MRLIPLRVLDPLTRRLERKQALRVADLEYLDRRKDAQLTRELPSAKERRKRELAKARDQYERLHAAVLRLDELK